MGKIILSISFCYHDSAITFANENEILLHLEAERYFRKKHMRFRSLEEVDKLVKYGLTQLNLKIDDISEVLVSKWNNLYNGNDVTILGKNFKAILTGHHENHIGTAFPSGFEKCVILCSDGGSEDGVIKLYYKDGRKIWFVEDLEDKIFTGKFYGTIAQMIIEPKCGEAHRSGVGKLMGLSSYGEYDKNLEEKFKENLSDINSLHFDNVDELRKIFELPNSYDRVWKDKYKQNIANTAHNLWVNECAKYLRKHSEFSKKIYIVGGCALNISLNSKLIDDKIFDNVYVGPISTDAGQSLGAILYRYPHIKCNYPYLGIGKESNILCDNEIIEDLIQGKIISWYQGRAEIGARALGHRSFIGIPTTMEMKTKISEKIKKREPYRPVAAIIPREMVSEYFYQDYDSPYMTFCARAKDITKKIAPAVVHVDGTTRVQTLTEKDNPILYNILLKLKEKIGVPILMNTSFNVMGEPIVNDIDDAINMHKLSNADELYINGSKYREKKLVSIIVPTYNNNEKLDKMLESLEKSKILDNKEIEVIVVQNHPDKLKYEETKKLQDKYNILVFHQPKEGKAAALNYGIKKSNGKYIASTDDDVIITDPEWISKFIKEFEKNPNLGYVSGNVIMYKDDKNEYSDIWENKGGLSKGKAKKYWSYDFLNGKKYKIFPWPLHKLCAGANQMIRKDVLCEVGGYAEFLGTRNNVDGLTLEIGYKVAKNGYELLYNPNIYLYHKHPKSEESVKNKLFYYGKQDTGVSMYIFLKHRDWRYLWWALFGHTTYTLKKMVKRVFGKYSLPISYIVYSLKGNLIGWFICLKNYKKGDVNKIGINI